MAQLTEFASNHWALVLALFLILGLLLASEIRRLRNAGSQVEPQQAVQLINHQNAVLVDFREEKEYADGVIPDAIKLPLSRMETDSGSLEKFRSRPIIAVCNSGNRSVGACDRLKKEGFESVYNLAGGFLAWKSANLPIQRPQ